MLSKSARIFLNSFFILNYKIKGSNEMLTKKTNTYVANFEEFC